MRKVPADPAAIPCLGEEEIMNKLRKATDPEGILPALMPPGGRFKAMAAEAGRRRRRRLLLETLLFLGSALLLLSLEVVLLTASLPVFGLFQGIGLMIGLAAFLAFHPYRNREVDHS